MNVLLIAPPRGDLTFVDAEVQAVANALHPDLLLGASATVDAVMRAVQGEYDLIWFACHGTDQGVELADGLLASDDLTQFLRGSSAAIFLNSCNSLGVAMALHDQLDMSVICTIARVADEQAYHTGALFAGHLAEGRDLCRAYELGKPGSNRQFVFLNGSIEMSRHERLDEVLSMVYGLVSKLDDMDRRFDERIANIEHDFGRRFDSLEHRYQFKLTRRNTLSWSVGFSIFSVVMALGYVDVRHLLNISWQASFIISIPLLAMSATMIGIGLGMSWERGKNDET